MKQRKQIRANISRWCAGNGEAARELSPRTEVTLSNARDDSEGSSLLQQPAGLFDRS